MEHIILDGEKQVKRPKKIISKHTKQAIDLTKIIGLMFGIEKEEISETLLEEKARFFYENYIKEK